MNELQQQIQGRFKCSFFSSNRERIIKTGPQLSKVIVEIKLDPGAQRMTLICNETDYNQLKGSVTKQRSLQNLNQ